MAVETVAQCDWLGLLTSGTLIPASAFVAICLFILREWLDWRRKSKARKNEVRALKKIFARECQLLQRVLGHTDIKMTMRYAHFAPDHLEDAVKLNPLAIKGE